MDTTPETGFPAQPDLTPHETFVRMVRKEKEQEDDTRAGERSRATGMGIYRDDRQPVSVRSYDEHQLEAINLSWRCCRREFYATNPAFGCLACR